MEGSTNAGGKGNGGKTPLLKGIKEGSGKTIVATEQGVAIITRDGRTLTIKETIQEEAMKQSSSEQKE